MDQTNITKTIEVKLKDMTDSQKLTKLVELQNEATDSLEVIAKKTSTIATIVVIGFIFAVLAVLVRACASIAP